MIGRLAAGLGLAVVLALLVRPRDAKQPAGTADAGTRARGRPTGGPRRRHGRTAVEWVSFTISLVIVLGLVGLVAYDAASGGHTTPAIVVRPLPEQARLVEEVSYVPVEIVNEGGSVAEELSIEVALVLPDGRRERATTRITSLPGGARARAMLGYRARPADGWVEVESISFLSP